MMNILTILKNIFYCVKKPRSSITADNMDILTNGWHIFENRIRHESNDCTQLIESVRFDEFGCILYLECKKNKVNDYTYMFLCLKILNEKKFIYEFAVPILGIEHVSDDFEECLFHWKMSN